MMRFLSGVNKHCTALLYLLCCHGSMLLWCMPMMQFLVQQLQQYAALVHTMMQFLVQQSQQYAALVHAKDAIPSTAIVAVCCFGACQ